MLLKNDAAAPDDAPTPARTAPLGRRKLIVQIPCFNEEETLPETVGALPRSVPGFDVVEFLVIDDGSTDRTAEVARRLGVHHVVSLRGHHGLARAFLTGLEEAVRWGADVIVNTDGDNQYSAADIPRLVEPVLSGRAEIVIGTRDVSRNGHFSPAKKMLQHMGSRVVSAVSGISVPDAASGFRAFSRRAAREINVFDAFSHTLETIIQAGHRGIAVSCVPVDTNPPTRGSRLAGSTSGYVLRSALTIGRILVTYRPLACFLSLGLASGLVGFLLGVRYLHLIAVGEGKGHVQSVVGCALALGIGALLVMAGLLGDLSASNRKILERIDTRLFRLEDEAAQRGTGDEKRGRPQGSTIR